MTVQIARSGWRPPVFGLALIAPLVCAYGTIVAAGFPVIDQTRPTPSIARWMTQTSPGSTEPIALYRLSRWKASLRFYSGRKVATVENVEELQRFLGEHPAASVVLVERDSRRLAEAGIVLTTVYKREAVLGTEGRGLRRQQWGPVVVATLAR